MKIGIVLIGVSYNDGSHGRYRYFMDSYPSFNKFITQPLIEQGHDVEIYLYTYDSVKTKEMLDVYNPKEYQLMPASEVNTQRSYVLNYNYIEGLKLLKNKELDFVISTRFDLGFLQNPLLLGNLHYDKFNFLFKEYLWWNEEWKFTTDTFYAFDYKFLEPFISACEDMLINPVNGKIIGMHNILPSLEKFIGNKNTNIILDEIYWTGDNPFFKLLRNE
jgi:hypothetical protein